MDTELLKIVEKRIAVAIGSLTLVQADNLDKEQRLFLESAKAQLIGTKRGLRIILDNRPVPITISDLEQKQFDTFTEIVSDMDCSDVHSELY